MTYIKTQQAFDIIQAIPDSINTNTVNIKIYQLSTEKYWSGTGFVAGEESETMDFVIGEFWKYAFTPNQDDTYLIEIENEELDEVFHQTLISVAGGVIDTGWTHQTKISICNMALRMLGAGKIISLNEDTTTARVLNDIYDLILDEVLAVHSWNFAIKRAALSRLAETPTFGYTYVFALPANCLRIIDTEAQDEFRREGNKLLSNSPSCKIKYISRETDPALYPQPFITVLASRLAAEIAYPITGDAKLAGNKMKEYELKISRAKSTNAQEGTPQRRDGSSWLNAR